ncbi:hypothetical protein BGZ89_009935 [Linnemannia elongata]|nr:hypothetical protein BGZ89_009935 [Linnemannia elongata]
MSSSSPLPSSQEQFFNTPELVYITAGYLEIDNISQLVQTSRQLNQWCEPLLFTHLKSEYYAPYPLQLIKVFELPSAVDQLSKHISSVRTLDICRLDRAYLYNWFLTHQKATPSATLPTWLPPPNKLSLPDIPLAPMTNLTELKMDFEAIYHQENFACFFPSANTTLAIFSQVCWMLQLNPNLVKLSMNWLRIGGMREAWFLAGVIAGLSRLRELECGLTFWSHVDIFPVWSDLLLSAPLSLKKFHVSIDSSISGRNLEGESVFGGEALVVKRPRQRELLPALVDLALPYLDTVYSEFTASDIGNVLDRYCPNIESVCVKHGDDDQIYHPTLIPMLVPSCPKLRRLKFDAEEEWANLFDSLPSLMMALPAGQLEEVDCLRYKGPRDFNQWRLAFRRHSISLRRITFDDCDECMSPVIGLVLTECSGLEELSLHGLSFIQLSDAATGQPWTCTNIRRLDLAIVDVPNHPYNAGDMPDAQKTKIMSTNTTLERLYQQIGTLAQLRYLRLRALQADKDGRACRQQFYDQDIFPKLMTLGDKETGKQGFLSLLGGLTKLQEIRGSVYILEEEEEVTDRWPEARWIHDHWPDLRVAEFYLEDEKPAECFQWLRDQRQRWKLALSVPYEEGPEPGTIVL